MTALCDIIQYISIRIGDLYFLFFLETLVLSSLQLPVFHSTGHKEAEDEFWTRFIHAHRSTTVFSNPKISRVRQSVLRTRT